MTAQTYGWAHQKTRAALVPVVAAGQAYCAERVCLERTRWIAPGSTWDLAHDRSTGEYLGPAHARCNRAEGGREAQRRARLGRTVRRWVL